MLEKILEIKEGEAPKGCSRARVCKSNLEDPLNSSLEIDRTL